MRAQVLVSCLSLLLASAPVVLAQDTTAAPATNQERVPQAQAADTDTTAVAKIPAEQLDALVAPIALYPDDLLAQTLVASTYPLEIIQLQQWLAKHPGLKDKALADSVAKQPWDPSIQSMAAIPDVVKRLADDVQWATDLGNAFLAQQGDVMEAVQRMRTKAKANGALESNEKQKVDTQVVEQKTVIVVESTDPEVIYVPSYSPAVVYGPPVYPYPPIYYPYYPPGAAMVSFSFGFMMGAAMWGGSCCHSHWGGGNTVIINNNNNFNQINHNNRGGGGNNNWQHNPSHRGGTPYGDRGTAGKYGGSSRGPSAGTQPAGSGRGPSAGTHPSTPGGQRSPSASDRSAGGAGGRTGGNQVGSRDVSPGSSAKSNGFGGGSGGYSGASARTSSSRGASSMRSSRGGGGARRR
jgi:hypothetical protein